MRLSKFVYGQKMLYKEFENMENIMEQGTGRHRKLKDKCDKHTHNCKMNELALLQSIWLNIKNIILKKKHTYNILYRRVHTLQFHSNNIVLRI